MLVYAKTPKGVLHLPNRQRVYGAAMGRAPVDVPFEVYEAYEGAFVDATYRASDLQRIFDRPFTPVAFKLSELIALPFVVIRKLASEMGVVHGNRLDRIQMVRAIKAALRLGKGICRGCNKEFVRGHNQQEFCKPGCWKKSYHGSKR